MDNCIYSTKKILQLLNVKHTDKYVRDTVLSHPDHPSLLSISDTLDKYKIENLAVKVSAEKLEELLLPTIVQISVSSTSLFYILNEYTKDRVSFFNDKNELVNTSRDEFLKIWTGICLLVEKSKNSKEIDIGKKLASKRTLNFLKISLAALLTAWAALLFSDSEIMGNLATTSYVLGYALLKITGLVVGILLLWYEVDKYNPTLQSFCSGGKKVNCNSVLGSKYAQMFNGTLSLSLIGFSYFFGTLAYLLVNGFSFSAMSLLSFFSFAVVPAVIMSIYYQAVVIKQWCKFCVILQVVLSAEILLGFMGGFYKTGIAFETLPLFVALLLIPIVGWKHIRPLLEQEKETNLYKRVLKKIKNNPDVLEGLLNKTRKITNSTEGLGISITKETAKYNVVKVCNPYCGPCAKAHPVLEKLVNEGKINLQTLFTARTNGDMAKPVRHFLAIDEQGDKNTTKQALDDWYLTEKKDYEVFAKKYPMNGELKKQNNKMEAMNIWCNAENITHTPTIFINGYQLPREYSIKDLTEVLQ